VLLELLERVAGVSHNAIDAARSMHRTSMACVASRARSKFFLATACFRVALRSRIVSRVGSSCSSATKLYDWRDAGRAVLGMLLLQQSLSWAFAEIAERLMRSSALDQVCRFRYCQVVSRVVGSFFYSVCYGSVLHVAFAASPLVFPAGSRVVVTQRQHADAPESGFGLPLPRATSPLQL
jgi:hypothetical protein